LPKAAVVLSVRGLDPQLEETLENLLDQDYPDFTVHIVVDAKQDPALDVIRDVLGRREATNVSISFLRDRKANCSLKCSALIEAIGELQESHEVIAFIDGDALPYPAWLRDLVAPLKDPKIGVSTGNRWYAPAETNWGSLVRYFWNAGAVVQVWMNGIVWAGSMAMRTEVIRKVGLATAWSRALSVDATINRQMRKHGYSVHFVPSVMVLNREQISLSAFLGWVQRQLIAARSSGGGWVMVTLHTLALALINLGSLGLAITALFLDNLPAAAVSGIGLAFFWVASLASTAAIELPVRRVVRRYGGACRWLSPAALARVFPALILTYLLYPCVFAWASLRKRVTWRGVEYDIARAGKVRMIHYQPIRLSLPTDANASVV